MTLRMRHVAHVNPGSHRFTSLPSDAEVTFHPLETVWADERADRSRRRPKGEVSTGFIRFEEGDVLMPKTAPTFAHGRSMVACALVNAVGAGSSELHVLRARPGYDPRFLAYTLRSSAFLAAGQGAYEGVAGLQRVSTDFVADYPVAELALSHQRLLSDFLDVQVALVEDAIALRQRQVELLIERERANVDTLLAALLRDRPLVPVKYLVAERDERDGGSEDPPPLMSVSIHRGVVLRSDLTDKEPRAEDLANYKVCRSGDLVLNRMRAFQGGVGVTPRDGLVSPDYAVLRPHGSVTSAFDAGVTEVTEVL